MRGLLVLALCALLNVAVRLHVAVSNEFCVTLT